MQTSHNKLITVEKTMVKAYTKASAKYLRLRARMMAGKKKRLERVSSSVDSRSSQLGVA